MKREAKNVNHTNPLTSQPTSQHRPRAGWLLRLSRLNAALFVLLWLGQRFVGERCWLTMLLAYLPQALFAGPAALLLVAALWQREGRALGWNLAALVWVGIVLMGMAVPVGRWRGVEGTTLRVMTWNVHFGSSGVDRLIRALERFQPDVVCLQEAKAYRQRRDPVPELREAFPQWHWARQGEFVVASRFPLVTSRPRPLSDRKGLRPSLAVTLQAKGTTLTVFNVHWSTAATSTNLTRNLRQPESYLKHSHQVRMKQAEGVRRLVAEARGPVLVAGDFNTPPRSQPYRRLTAALQDCFARGGWGWGYTYRSDRPILRIDYVFASPEVKVRRCFVPRIGGSDHRPVVADVVLP